MSLCLARAAGGRLAGDAPAAALPIVRRHQIQPPFPSLRTCHSCLALRSRRSHAPDQTINPYVCLTLSRAGTCRWRGTWCARRGSSSSTGWTRTCPRPTRPCSAACLASWTPRRVPAARPALDALHCMRQNKPGAGMMPLHDEPLHTRAECTCFPSRAKESECSARQISGCPRLPGRVVQGAARGPTSPA